MTPRWPQSNPGYTRVTPKLHQIYAKLHLGNSWKRPGHTRVTPGLHAGRTQVTPGHVHFTPASDPSYTQVTPWLHLGCTRSHRQCTKVTPRIHQGRTEVTPASRPGYALVLPWSRPAPTPARVLPRCNHNAARVSTGVPGKNNSTCQVPALFSGRSVFFFKNGVPRR